MSGSSDKQTSLPMLKMNKTLYEMDTYEEK